MGTGNGNGSGNRNALCIYKEQIIKNECCKLFKKAAELRNFKVKSSLTSILSIKQNYILHTFCDV